jgi:hypothetical protein
MGGIEGIKFVQREDKNALWQTPNTRCRSAMKEICRSSVTEGSYHVFTVTGLSCNIILYT